MTYLSDKPIPVEERLIMALDVDNRDQAEAFIRDLGDAVRFYKLGLQLFMTGDYFALAEDLVRQGKRVFVDLKFFDVPPTVASAVRQLKDRGVDFVSVHGNEQMIEAAVAEKNEIKILAVTVLTSLDDNDLADLGFEVDVKTLVLSRARRALARGCDGVISSGWEAPSLRQEFGGKFLIVAPGIRPVANVDDQKRTVNVEKAFQNGADYIVVGRPIRDAADPRAAADDIQARIARTFDA